jgi:hypothetical protein
MPPPLVAARIGGDVLLDNDPCEHAEQCRPQLLSPTGSGRIADYLRLTSAVSHRDTRVQNFQFWIAPQL